MIFYLYRISQRASLAKSKIARQRQRKQPADPKGFSKRNPVHSEIQLS
jgi:hypothetical protein